VRSPAKGPLAAAVLLAAAGCSRRPTSPAVPPGPSGPSYEMRLGKHVFQHYCQTCHGETGAGDGFNAFNLDPRPRDLSDPAFQSKKSDADLADAVRRGGSGVGLSPLMPPWGRTLSAQEIDQVVLYIRSLKKPAS
jgi:mono/diheme cytochrome c family protein